MPTVDDSSGPHSEDRESLYSLVSSSALMSYSDSSEASMISSSSSGDTLNIYDYSSIIFYCYLTLLNALFVSQASLEIVF